MAVSLQEILDALEDLSGAEKKKLKKSLGISDSAKGDDESDAKYEARIESAQKLALAEANIAARLKDTAAQRQALSDVYENALILEEQAIAAAGEGANRQEIINKLEEEHAARLGITIEHYQEMMKAAKDAHDEQAKLGPLYDKLQRESDALFGSIANHLGIASSLSDTFAGKLIRIGELAKSDEGLKALHESFKKTFNMQNLVLSAASKFAEMSFAMAAASNKASAAFALQTGAGDIMNESIHALGRNHRNLGITFEDSSKAHAELYSRYPGFADMSMELTQKLGHTAAGLDKLGFSLSESAELMVNFEKALGFTTEQSADMTKQLAMSGKAMGMDVKQYMNSLNKAMPILNRFGTRAPKIFTKLAAQARAAGVEIGTLVKLGDDFKTFDGAASKAAKLNAILGTQLSTTDLLGKSTEEVTMTLIKSFQSQGRAFKRMGPYEQLAIAETLGMTTQEASKILDMNTQEYRKNLAAAKAKADADKEFNDSLQKGIDVGKKLQLAMSNLAVAFEPVITLVADVAQGFLNFSQKMAGLPAMIMGAIVFIGALAFALSPVVTIFAALAGGSGAAAAGAGISNFGAAAGKSAPGIAAFGGSLMTVAKGMLVIGISIGIMVGAVALMINAMAKSAEAGIPFGDMVAGVITLLGSLAAVGTMAGLAMTAFAAGTKAMTAAFLNLGRSPLAMKGALVMLGFAAAAAAQAYAASKVAAAFQERAKAVAEFGKAVAESNNAEFGGVFNNMTNEIGKAQAYIEKLASSDVNIVHLISDLATISSGTSATTMNRSVGMTTGLADISNAIREGNTASTGGEGGKFRFFIDAASIKQALEEGYFELDAQ